MIPLGLRVGSGQVSEQTSPTSEQNLGGTSEHTAPQQTPHKPSPHLAGEGRKRKKPGFIFFPCLLWLTSVTLTCQKQFANSIAVGASCSKLPPYRPGQATHFLFKKKVYSLQAQVNSHLSPLTSSTLQSLSVQTQFAVHSFAIIILLLVIEELQHKLERLQGPCRD